MAEQAAAEAEHRRRTAEQRRTTQQRRTAYGRNRKYGGPGPGPGHSAGYSAGESAGGGDVGGESSDGGGTHDGDEPLDEYGTNAPSDAAWWAEEKPLPTEADAADGSYMRSPPLEPDGSGSPSWEAALQLAAAEHATATLHETAGGHAAAHAAAQETAEQLESKLRAIQLAAAKQATEAHKRLPPPAWSGFSPTTGPSSSAVPPAANPSEPFAGASPAPSAGSAQPPSPADVALGAVHSSMQEHVAKMAALRREAAAASPTKSKPQSGESAAETSGAESDADAALASKDAALADARRALGL